MQISKNEYVDVRAIRHLASNIGDVAKDCCGNELDLRGVINREFPIISLLLRTQLSSQLRGNFTNCNTIYKRNEDVGRDMYYLQVPASVYSLPVKSTIGECCFAPIDLAKCAGEVPLFRLCLKDCETLDDILMADEIKLNTGIAGLVNKGMSLRQARLVMDRLSYVFQAGKNIINGVKDLETETQKPFHGLLEVYENPAVIPITAQFGILNAFKSLGCRINAMRGNDTFWFTCHPIVYQAIRSRIHQNVYGELPDGWSKLGNEYSLYKDIPMGDLTFNGIPFVLDKNLTPDIVGQTGEVYMISSNAVGMWLKNDLANPKQFGGFTDDNFIEEAYDECGSRCMFLYTIGAVVNNNADRIAKIVDIPLDNVCLTGLQGIDIVPQTLIG